MKFSLTLLFAGLVMFSKAQIFGIPEQPTPTEPDTIYYTFDHDIQWIEVDHFTPWQSNIAWHEITQPRALTWEMVLGPARLNEHIFRNLEGKVIAVYNSAHKDAWWEKKLSQTPESFKGRKSSWEIANLTSEINYSPFFSGHNSQRIGDYLVVSDEFLPDHMPMDNRGLINRYGEIVVEKKYSDIYLFGKIFITNSSRGMGVLDFQLKEILPEKFGREVKYDEKLATFSDDGITKYAYDYSEDRFFPTGPFDQADIDYISQMKINGFRPLAKVTYQGKAGLVDEHMNLVLPLEYDYVNYVSEGMIAVCKENKWGFINEDCELIIPFQFEDAQAFYDGYATCVLNGQTVYIDKNGNVHDLPQPRSEAFETSNWHHGVTHRTGLRVIDRTHMYGLQNQNGHIVAPITFQHIAVFNPHDPANDFNTTYLIVKKFDRFGIITTQGHWVVPCIYDEIEEYVSPTGYIRVKKKYAYGYLNTSFEEVIPCVFEYVNAIHGLPLIISKKNNEKMGVMNGSMNYIIPPNYDMIHFIYADSTFAVQQNEKFGIIDQFGKLKVPIEFQYIHHDLIEGKHVAGINDKFGLIDETGQWVIQPVYDQIRGFYNGYSAVVINQKFGLINLEGKLVIPCEYDYLTQGPGDKDHFKVMIKDKYGLVNTKGKVVLDIIYEDVIGYSEYYGYNVVVNGEIKFAKAK